MTKFDTAVSAYTHHVSKVDLLCTFPPTAGTASPLGTRLDSLKVSNQIRCKTFADISQVWEIQRTLRAMLAVLIVW